MARKAKNAEKAPKPELFVGSSAEAIKLSNSVVQVFHHDFRVTPWTAGVFEPSSNPLGDLVRQVGRTAYGVFIFARDDKVTSRHKQQDAARDNVIFELGLFMGRLGPQNCFVLVPKNRKGLKIPSDLDGFSLVPYEDDRLDDNPKAAFAAACASISEAIERRRKEAAPMPATDSAPPPALTSPPPGVVERIRADLQDLLGMVHNGDAGLEVVRRDSRKFERWARNALHMARLALQEVTPKPPADAHIVWLRPTPPDPQRLSYFLGDNAPDSHATDHHPFSLGEGLAGTVWEEGRPGSHSPARPHDKWRPRANCTNESYVCVPVGKAAGPGGVLGFGSNESFETIREQVAVMEAYAAVLAAALPLEGLTAPGKGGQSGGVSPRDSASRSRSRRRSTG